MSESEASALLRAGRFIRDASAYATLLVTCCSPGSNERFSLYFDDEPIYHFDLDGRWQRAYIDGNHCRKALNQSVDLIGRTRVPEGIALTRRAGSRAEIDSDDSIRATALDVSVGLSRERYTIVGPPDPAAALDVEDLRDLLDRVATWDAAAWFARMEQFVRVYGTRPASFPPMLRTPSYFSPAIAMASPGVSTSSPSIVGTWPISWVVAIQASTAFLDDASSLRAPSPRSSQTWTRSRLSSRFAMTRVPSDRANLPPDQPLLSGIDLLSSPATKGVSCPIWKDGRRSRVVACGASPCPSALAWPVTNRRRASLISSRPAWRCRLSSPTV